jgi:hypothetical protein
MKNTLSVAAALAALALTSTAGLAQTAPPTQVQDSITPLYGDLNGPNKSTQTNSAIPGSPGYTGAAMPAGAHGFPGSSDGGITKDQMIALYGELNGPNKDTQTNSMIPGSPGYTGAGLPAGAKGFPTSPDGITQRQSEALNGDLNAAAKDTQTNSAIPGSAGFTNSTKPAGAK